MNGDESLRKGYDTMAERSKGIDLFHKIPHRLKWKTIIIVLLVIAVIFGVRYMRAIYLEKQFNEMKYDMKVKWFCLEECSDMLREKNQFNICEEHNAEVMEKVEAWNQYGLRSFMDWDEKVYTNIKNAIAADDRGTRQHLNESDKAYMKRQEELEKKRQNALLLIDGGGDILNMDFEEFLNAVDYIEEMGISEPGVKIGTIGLQWKIQCYNLSDI